MPRQMESLRLVMLTVGAKLPWDDYASFVMLKTCIVVMTKLL
jgi:hypothetical protein